MQWMFKESDYKKLIAHYIKLTNLVTEEIIKQRKQLKLPYL